MEDGRVRRDVNEEHRVTIEHLQLALKHVQNAELASRPTLYNDVVSRFIGAINGILNDSAKAERAIKRAQDALSDASQILMLQMALAERQLPRKVA